MLKANFNQLLDEYREKLRSQDQGLQSDEAYLNLVNLGQLLVDIEYRHKHEKSLDNARVKEYSGVINE